MNTLFLTTIEDALQQSRNTIRRYYRQRIIVESKADASPVTEADRIVESQIRHIISQRHPQHSIIGEEHGTHYNLADYTWVIDPIDGTKSFISGMPTFGTLIGITHYQQPKIGVIDMPILDERWIGTIGENTTCNGTRCSVSKVQQLAHATLYCTEPDMFNAAQLNQFETLSNLVYLRRFGGDCYSYGLLASGQIDLVVEGDLHYYDIMALIPVVKGAGGVITDWQGKELEEGWNGLVVAAATPALHQAALTVLNGY